MPYHPDVRKVCLGFPISTLAGLRGQAGDPVLELKTPVLFVVRKTLSPFLICTIVFPLKVGERSSQAGSDDVEDLRERLSVETALVIVGGADDGLRLSKKKKKAENVTQCMVGFCSSQGEQFTFPPRWTGALWTK